MLRYCGWLKTLQEQGRLSPRAKGLFAKALPRIDGGDREWCRAIRVCYEAYLSAMHKRKKTLRAKAHYNAWLRSLNP